MNTLTDDRVGPSLGQYGTPHPSPAKSIKGVNALVIGGSGGIGRALVNDLDRLGAARIYIASTRRTTTVPNSVRQVAETVDVTSQASVRALANGLKDAGISLVINCAGFNGNCRLQDSDNEQTARREMEVNYFGLMHVAAAFAPLLASNGGGTLMTILSFVSHVSLPTMATYCASKAAAHSLTQSLRAEWTKLNVKICGVYPTAVDTQMSMGYEGPKQSPSDLANAMLLAVSQGVEDLYPGDAEAAYANLLRDPKQMEILMRSALT